MKKVLIVVPDGSEEMEVSPFIEMPGWTKVVPDIERVDTVVAGWDDVIQMFHGMKIVPDIKMDEVDPDEFDAICIPGGWPGTKYFDQINSELSINMIKKMHADGKLIATMCFGVLAVGEAGLLKGVKATSFAGECCEMCKQVKEKVISYGADFQEKAMVFDNNILSDIGPAVGDEVALKMMELLIGEEATLKIVDMMMYNRVDPKELKYTYPRIENKESSCTQG
jgi:4-methyl-5(b-hydroxyethyl)-thiazole monophosphate biosynthesis